MAILLFGDFGQLPPVMDKPLYKPEASLAQDGLSEQGRRVYEAITQSVTLETIFRQQGQDPKAVAFRQALLHQREYQIQEDDYKLLQTRSWDKLSAEERTNFSMELHLLPTHALKDAFNGLRLASLNKPVVKCKAKHSGVGAKQASDDDAGGLEKTVLLAEGARVMVTRNLWTSHGLVNGAQGTVRKIIYDPTATPGEDLPAVVLVQVNGYTGMSTLQSHAVGVLIKSSFDSGPACPSVGGVEDQCLVPIVPATSQWEANGQQCSRRQLPLALAFGITIHKSQGLTLERAVIELGPRDFSNGLAFVAMSRVKTLKGLAFRTPFSIERLKKADGPGLVKLREDYARRQQLGFQLNDYDQDLSMYTFNQ